MYKIAQVFRCALFTGLPVIGEISCPVKCGQQIE